MHIRFSLQKIGYPNRSSISFDLHDSYENGLFKDSKFMAIHKASTEWESKISNDRDRIADCAFNIATFKVYLMRYHGIHPYSMLRYDPYFDNIRGTCPIESTIDFKYFWQCARVHHCMKLLAIFNNEEHESIPADVDAFIAKIYSYAYPRQSLNHPDNRLLKESDTILNKEFSENTREDGIALNTKVETLMKSHPDNAGSNMQRVDKLIKASTVEDIQNLNDLELNCTDKSNDSVNYNDSPPKWFKEYMDQFKKDIVTEISCQVISNIMEYFNGHSVKSFTYPQCDSSKQEWQCINKDRNLGNEESVEHVDSTKVVVEQANIEELANHIETIKIEQKKQNPYVTETINNVYKTACLPEEAFVSRERAKENLHKKLASSSSLRYADGEPRMNCSVTGCDVLKVVTLSDTNSCYEPNADNVSLSSNISENSEMCNFEMVHKQQLQHAIEIFIERYKLNKENNEECSSYEILSGTLSSSSSSIDVDEHHFFANEENIPNSTDISNISKSNKLNYAVAKSDNNLTREIDNTTAVESIIGMDFLNIPTQHDCQAQTTTNNFTQSFHSHTASVAADDNNSSMNRICDNNNGSIQHIKKEFDNRNLKRNMKETSFSNNFTAEPVHILPETLVTGAIHVASLAYGTAREAFDKIRFNVKEGRLSHKEPDLQRKQD